MDGDSGDGLRQAEPFALPIGEYLGRLRRQRRFLALGLVASWGIVVTVGLVVPRTYQAEATLAAPDASALRPAEPGAAKGTPGIPIQVYKKLERALRESAPVQSAFAGEMSDRELQALRLGIERHVSPLTSTVRNEIVRIERDDTIVALQLAIEASSAARAAERMRRLSALVRQRLTAVLALDVIDAGTLRTRTETLIPALAVLELADANRSLRLQASDLEALAARSGRAGDAARQVVSTADGGHRYLPPPLQLVGVRANVADNDHQIRILRQRVANAEAKIAFYKRLAQSIDSELRTHPTEDVDWPALLRRERDALASSLAPRDTDYLRVEEESLADTLTILRSAMRYVEAPTLRRKPRALTVLLGIAGATVAMLLAAIFRDLFRGREPARG